MSYMTGRTSLFSLAVLLASPAALAIDVPTGTKDFTLSIRTNLQLRLEGTWGGVPPTATSGPSPAGHFNSDIFLRRVSLATRGTIYKYFTYYLKLEASRFGSRGNYSVPTLVHDVVLGFVPVEDFNIEGGFLKTPLSRPSVDSSPATNSLEGVSDILKYPNAKSQRQMGLQIRSLLLDHRLLVRGGVYEGARTGESGGNPTTPSFPAPYVNPNGSLMLAGMLRLNLIGYETSYTYPALHLDGKSYMSFGVGGQYQQKSGGLKSDGTFNDYSALAADFYTDLALPGDQEAIVILGGYRFDYGDAQSKSGNGAHGELGYRWRQIGSQANFYWFNSNTRVNSSLKFGGGLTYFIKGHHVKIMAEYDQTILSGTLPSPGPASRWLHQIAVQAQFSF